MGELEPLIARFRDRARLRELHRLVESCPADGPPRAIVLPVGALAGARRLAVIPGSFNPLTRAHLALSDAAVAGGLSPVAFALATRTVDKERLEGAYLEDRLLVLELHAKRRPGCAVVLLNRGLYVDQANLLRAALPDLERLTFLVGFDKIVQIFDPRYYADRDAALFELFARADFAVAPRAGAGPRELAELLDRPENRPFGSGVRAIDLPRELATVASSTVRAALGAELPADDLPAESAAFIAATGCYAPPVPDADGRLHDRYAERRPAVWRDAPPDPPTSVDPPPARLPSTEEPT